MSKIHKLAAVSLALLAGNASAALTNGATLGAPSSILFAASDLVTKNTFILDLALGGHSGLNYSSFIYGTEGTNGSLSWNLADFNQFVDNGYGNHTASLKWSVLGGYALDTENLNNLSKTGPFADLFADAANTEWGALSTGINANNFAPQEYTKINGELTNTGAIGSWFGWVNHPTAANGANVASIAPVNGKSFYDLHLGGLGQLIFQPGAPSVTGAIAADFFRITNTDLEANNQITRLGAFSLSSNNVLTWNSANVSQVPIPAATWLFLSGLMGLVALRKRRS
jgi:hypothetical protein